MFVRNGSKVGSVLVDREVEASAEPEPEPQSEPEQRDDGVHSVGGGWHEVVIGGEVIDKVRGADAAKEAFEAYQESEPTEEADDGD
jgi:hypothetical protein